MVWKSLIYKTFYPLPSKSQLPPASSFILLNISSTMISSGTRPPLSTIAFAFKPTSVPSFIWERRTSPLDKWVTPKVFTIRSETVPLPDPGGPIMRARTGFEDILDKWIRRACLMELQRPSRIEWRRRTECIFSSKGWFYGQNAIDWELKTLRWQNMQRAHVFLHVYFCTCLFLYGGPTWKSLTSDVVSSLNKVSLSLSQYGRRRTQEKDFCYKKQNNRTSSGTSGLCAWALYHDDKARDFDSRIAYTNSASWFFAAFRYLSHNRQWGREMSAPRPYGTNPFRTYSSVPLTVLRVRLRSIY